MPWSYWVVNQAAGADPPPEWSNILSQLSGYVDKSYIDKIEVAAFTIRGERTARWRIPTNDPEYSTIENALGAAKKLTWLLLLCEGGPRLNDALRGSLKCTRTAHCTLLEGHEGGCSASQQVSGITKCPICLEPITLRDFDRDGRSDPVSAQMGHMTPLSISMHGHKADNVYWIHRRCNFIQDEQTISDTLVTLRSILIKHGFTVSNRT